MAGALTRMLGRTPAAGGASISIVGTPFTASRSTTGPITLTYPDRTAGNLAVIAWGFNTNGGLSIGSPPTGYTGGPATQLGAAPEAAIYSAYRTLDGSESATVDVPYTATSGTPIILAAMIVFHSSTGFAATPIASGVTNRNTTSSPTSSSSLVTTLANQTVVNLIAQLAQVTFTPPTGYTEQYDFNAVNGLVGLSFTADVAVIASAGSVTPAAATSSLSGKWGVASFALVPA